MNHWSFIGILKGMQRTLNGCLLLKNVFLLLDAIGVRAFSTKVKINLF